MLDVELGGGVPFVEKPNDFVGRRATKVHFVFVRVVVVGSTRLFRATGYMRGVGNFDELLNVIGRALVGDTGRVVVFRVFECLRV